MEISRFLRKTAPTSASLFVVSVLVTLALVGCGGTSAQRSNLALTATASSIHVNASTHFQVPGYADTAVQEWAVNGIYGGDPVVGTIDSNGNYKAPAEPPTPNTVVVSAFGNAFQATGSISVTNPAPGITTISPVLAMQGSPTMTLTVTGSGFTRQSQVFADGASAQTKFVSGTSLQATLTSGVLETAGRRTISVSTPSPGGGTTKTIVLEVIPSGTVSASKHPLVALYDIQPPHDAKVTVEFGPDTKYGKSTGAVSTPSGGGAVEVQVAGMIPASTYHMRAKITFSDGTTLNDVDHAFTTGAVPASRFANITTKTYPGMTPSPGVELMDLISPAPGTNLLQASAYDLSGRPVWYYDAEPGSTVIPLKLLPNGHFLLYIDYLDHANDSLREIDLVGNVIRDFKRTDLNNALAAHGYDLVVAQLHHDVLPLPNGHIILLGNFTKMIDGLTGYAVPTAVQGDVLVDLDPDLNPVWTWSSFDHLDPNRHLQGLPDWTHSNAVVYTPNDGNLLLSMRHQSWVLKIDYENGAGSGNIIWRLGDQGDFTLTSGDRSAWQYGQHYPRIISITGSVMRLGVMDNGNLRMDANGTPCGKGGATCYSRLPVFDIDEQSRTVTPVWEYRPGFYSFWGGSAEFLPNGDVEGGFSAASPGSRIVEVTGGSNPQLVWEMDITLESVYRGFRIPSLYPGVQW